MKKIVLSILVIASLAVNAQVAEVEKTLRNQNADSTLGWKAGGVINIGFSQVSLTNWVAGGQSSVTTNGLLSLFAHKTIKRGLWENYLDMGYGILKQGEGAENLRKTDDRLEFLSKYGQKINEKLYYAGLVNFKTQLTDGYNYPDVTTPISRLLAPGYLLVALGIDYFPSKKLSLFIAPLTSKNTFVMDETLSNAGAFGVEIGETFRTEFGGYVRINYKTDVVENVNFQTRLDLFSNYLNNPQNIDVSWETLISMKVNKFISATVSTHLVYDDDIDIAVDENKDGITDAFGPRVQFKQLLSIGFNYKF